MKEAKYAGAIQTAAAMAKPFPKPRKLPIFLVSYLC